MMENAYKEELRDLRKKKITDVWKSNGIDSNFEYAILTNDIYKEWSGMIAKEGGEVVNNTRKDIEVRLGELVVTKNNVLGYKYIEDIDKIENI